MAVKAIVKGAADITLEAPKKTGTQKFCDTWPTAKTALVLLQSTIKNPIAKAAIGIVMDAGDAVAKRIC